MTVLTSETQLTWAPTPMLPRVNLLPPEIAEARAFRRVQLGLGAALLGSVGVVGLLFAGAAASASHAQSQLKAAQATQTNLQGQIGKYGDVTRVYAAAEAAQAALSTAMGDEVRYSQMLNDLSVTIPDNVWITGLAYAPVDPLSAPQGAAAGTLPVATLTMNGVAFSHDDVAVLLDSMMGLKTYANAYFTSSTEALIARRKVVNYAVTADVTNAARSGRYDTPAGG